MSEWEHARVHGGWTEETSQSEPDVSSVSHPSQWSRTAQTWACRRWTFPPPACTSTVLFVCLSVWCGWAWRRHRRKRMPWWNSIIKTIAVRNVSWTTHPQPASRRSSSDWSSVAAWQELCTRQHLVDRKSTNRQNPPHNRDPSFEVSLALYSWKSPDVSRKTNYLCMHSVWCIVTIIFF